MMGIATTILKAAPVAAAIGTIGGGALYLNNAHAPIERVEKLEASATVQSIQNWIRTAREQGPADYICDAIDAEFLALCSEMPNHYLCKAETQKEMKAKAGCGHQ